MYFHINRAHKLDKSDFQNSYLLSEKLTVNVVSIWQYVSVCYEQLFNLTKKVNLQKPSLNNQ